MSAVDLGWLEGALATDHPEREAVLAYAREAAAALPRVGPTCGIASAIAALDPDVRELLRLAFEIDRQARFGDLEPAWLPPMMERVVEHGLAAGVPGDVLGNAMVRAWLDALDLIEERKARRARGA